MELSLLSTAKVVIASPSWQPEADHDRVGCPWTCVYVLLQGGGVPWQE